MPTPPVTAKLQVNPIVGRRPVLQNCTKAELAIDPAYQRSIDSGASRRLVRAIARDWDWSLCLPLVVARRADDTLFVVDGQHRLAAARLRDDIYDLPCVITAYATPANEAETFVRLNRQRRPLTTMDLYRADLAFGDAMAMSVQAMLDEAGLQLTTNADQARWKPGQISNIGGILKCRRRHGAMITAQALLQLARSWPGQVLQYAGTLFGGIAATIAELGDGADMDLLQMVLEGATQPEWMREITRIEGERGIARSAAAAAAIREAYTEAFAEDQSEAA